MPVFYSRGIPLQEINAFSGRLKVISIILAIVILVLIGRAAYLQIYDGSYYAELANNNRIRLIPVFPH